MVGTLIQTVESDRGADATREAAGTSHFVIVDREGNIVSMTTTVESLFGSGRAVGGFMLNNQLTDFSYRPIVDGAPVANAVAGGKRPRSSMAPVMRSAAPSPHSARRAARPSLPITRRPSSGSSPGS